LRGYQLQFTKSFEKQFKKLPEKSKQKFYNRLKLFEDNPYNPQLANHGLKGKYLGYRSISIGSDLRALYTIRGDTIILFAFIGSHSQLY